MLALTDYARVYRQHAYYAALLFAYTLLPCIFDSLHAYTNNNVERIVPGKSCILITQEERKSPILSNDASGTLAQHVHLLNE